MKVMLVGRNARDLDPVAKSVGLAVVDDAEDADVIITYGGDGALIGAEKEWPGIPKLGLRDSRNAEKCAHHSDLDVLTRLARGDMDVSELMKLGARVNGDHFLGMNDVLLRNEDLRSAVRFVVHVNDMPITDEIIGDGLVASTPFGSSAYFRSITNVTFHEGIGLAFNNCTDFDNHFVLREDDVIRVHVIRGPAQVTADNDPVLRAVGDGDDIIIRKSREKALIYGVDTLRCGRCRYTHAPRRRF